MIVNEVIEDIVLGEGSRQNKGFRAGVVLFSAFIAWSIPDFGVSKNEKMFNIMPFLHGMFSYLPLFLQEIFISGWCFYLCNIRIYTSELFSPASV